SPDGRFDADPHEVDVLAGALHPWDEVGTGLTGAARATFRLAEDTGGPGADGLGADEPADGLGADGLSTDELDAGEPGAENLDSGGPGADEPGADEPRAEGGRWRLEFLLQSMADPSLLVPAAQAWADDGRLSRWLSRPHELLLAELGRACRVYPELADGLHQPQPCALE